MQDIPAASISNTEQTALLGTPTWDTNSVDNAAFSNLLAHESNVAQRDVPLPAAPQPEAVREPLNEQTASYQTSMETKANSETRDAVKEAARETAEAVAENSPEDPRDIIDAEHNLQDMKDVPVDMESFQGMRPQLARYGLSDENIATLERKVGSEKGLTWGELVSFVSKNMDSGAQTMDMTAQQQQKLMTFFQKLGFSAPESKRMMADLADGNAAQINDVVQKRLTTLPQDKLASLNKEELDAFNDLIKKAQSQMKAEDRTLIRVVGQAMENAMDKARRLALQQTQGNQANINDNNTAKTLAETATTKVETDISKASMFTDESPVADQIKSQNKDTEKLVKTLSTEDQLKARITQTEESMAKGAKSSTHQDTDAFLKQDSGTDDKAWNEFFEKLKLDDSGKATTTKIDSSRGFSEAVSQARSTAADAAKPLSRPEAPRVLKQVENALLKSLTGGGKRLTLQLNPEHLGAINVALTVKNSEVSATIRADNTDAARMIADQLESIRHSLEEQGLKVNKLEVQTQLQGGDQGTWQGMAGQEKAFQQGMWGRMREGMNGTGGNEMTAEQMSEMAREAILSDNGNGLHVVA